MNIYKEARLGFSFAEKEVSWISTWQDWICMWISYLQIIVVK